MGSIRELAQKIPDEVRSTLLITENDPILNAFPNSNNGDMKLLADIWYEFILPESNGSRCPICLENILTSFRQMKGDLIELEQEYRKLKSI
jgi:hypothetical protein